MCPAWRHRPGRVSFRFVPLSRVPGAGEAAGTRGDDNDTWSCSLFFLLYPCSQSSYLPFEKPKPGRRAAARLARHVVNSFTHSDVIAWAAAAAAQAREAGEGKATTEVGGEVTIYVRGGGTGKAKGKKEGGKREEKKLSCNRDLAREKLLLVATRICSVTAFRRRNVHDTHCSYVRTRTRYASPKVFGRAGPLWNALPFHDEGSLAPLAECPSPSGQFPDSWLAGTQMLRHDTTRHDTMGRRAYNALPCPVRPSWSARLCSAHCSGRTHARPHPVRHPTETGNITSIQSHTGMQIPIDRGGLEAVTEHPKRRGGRPACGPRLARRPQYSRRKGQEEGFPTSVHGRGRGPRQPQRGAGSRSGQSRVPDGLT